MKRISVADIEPLIEKNKGNVAAIARSLGVSWGTVNNRIAGSAVLQQAVAAARESMIDNAESALYKQILDGNITAIIFFLKTRGKKRGYVERQEVTGADGGPIEHEDANATRDSIERKLACISERSGADAVSADLN